MFQSAPGDEAGGNVVSGNTWLPWAPFQSAPGDEAGGNDDVMAGDDLMACFNPPPAMRPGETSRPRSTPCGLYRFNPPPAMRPGETPADPGLEGDPGVSIRPRR